MQRNSNPLAFHHRGPHLLLLECQIAHSHTPEPTWRLGNADVLGVVQVFISEGPDLLQRWLNDRAKESCRQEFESSLHSAVPSCLQTVPVAGIRACTLIKPYVFAGESANLALLHVV